MSQVEKSRLRKQLLDRRDSLSLDFINLASKKIQDNLRKIGFIKNSQSIGAYSSIGSEVRTDGIIKDLLRLEKEISLPKVTNQELVFKKIQSFEDLEQGIFSILEPKEHCKEVKYFDVIIVPAIAVSKTGNRLGYGYGYYDRFLAKDKSIKIALCYSKQIIKSLPHFENDILIDYVLSEDGLLSLNKV